MWTFPICWKLKTQQNKTQRSAVRAFTRNIMMPLPAIHRSTCMSDPVDQYLKGRIREAFCNDMLLLLLVMLTIVMTMVMIVFYEGVHWQRQDVLCHRQTMRWPQASKDYITLFFGQFWNFFVLILVQGLNQTFLYIFCAGFITRPKFLWTVFKPWFNWYYIHCSFFGRTQNQNEKWTLFQRSF